ncbi:MAG: prepilin-type N-terminal cleavage/methylation domain-containing protein [Thermoleophilia bacterium]|nr:prepilin-type N-terminal cleavage/methylation domain-containing protein [Thermoleophilia bacterium]
MRRLPPHVGWTPGQAQFAGTQPPAGGGGGFTLIELLVTMMVAAIMAAAILGIYSSALHTFAAQQVRIQNQDDARLAINQMSRYLRMAASSASNQTTRSDAIAYAQAQDVVFYADLDGDGDTDKAR